jgi:hypothetical protein
VNGRVGFALLRDLDRAGAMQAGALFLVDSDSVQVAQERESYLCYVLGPMINHFPGRQGARFFLFTVFLGLVAVNSVVLELRSD